MPASPAADEDFENARKRQIDNDQSQLQSGPPIKKPRLSNGYENGFECTPMDVDDDQNGDGNAYPSPEQVPSPVVVTIGPEQGTQVDKVHELSTETTFLELSDDPSSRNAVLLHCEFNPRDPAILAAAGTDALARMWTLSRIVPDSGSESPRKPIFASAHNLLDESAPPSTTTTALSWSSDGSCIAVASDPTDDGNDSNAKVEFWNTNGVSVAQFNSFEPVIICLRWNLGNTACLAISPQNEDRGTLMTVMFPNTLTSLSYSLPNHSLDDQPLDAAWTSHDEFVICGGSLLQAYHCGEGSLSPGRKYETREADTLSKITYDWRSRLLATANDSGTINVSRIGKYFSRFRLTRT
jgi:transducin (beta)-like 1